MKKKVRQLSNRSGKELCNICTAEGFLEEHHINGREVRGFNDPWNVCNICPNCHTKVHYGEIIMEKWVMTSTGRELFWHKKGEASITGFEAAPPLVKTKD